MTTGSNPTSNLMAGAGLGGTMQNGPVAPNGTYVNMGPGFAGSRTEKDYGANVQSNALAGLAKWENQKYQMWTTDHAKNMFDALPAEARALASRYTAALAGHDKSPRWTVQSKYNDAVDATARWNLMSGQNMSLWEYMDMVASEEAARRGGSSGSGGGGGGGGGGGPSTTVQYNLTNQSDAETLVDQALNQYLGRQATDKERDQFWKVLNKAEMKAPTVTQHSGGQNPTVKTSGGLNPQQAAREFATSRKDAAEYMANTQYTDWLLEKVSADPTEGIASGL